MRADLKRYPSWFNWTWRTVTRFVCSRFFWLKHLSRSFRGKSGRFQGFCKSTCRRLSSLQAAWFFSLWQNNMHSVFQNKSTRRKTRAEKSHHPTGQHCVTVDRDDENKERSEFRACCDGSSERATTLLLLSMFWPLTDHTHTHVTHVLHTHVTH